MIKQYLHTSPIVWRRFIQIFILGMMLSSCNELADVISVSSVSEFDQAVKSVHKGQTIELKNGIWKDAELVFKGMGTSDLPIRLKAETPGEVILSGQSNLQISGQYLVVSGLVFRDGYTPTGEVLSFRTGKNELANNTRVTNCVIDNYSNPERFDGDTWVAIYGKNNQFDHNTLQGKGNRGVTLAVKLGTEADQENSHIISDNYFGPREILGSNGGETLRIGTSHFSKTYSNTVVERNYFDRCNGEHEIISNKSCGNVFRDNVFFESQGTLTMRHGHHTLVEQNYFLGNRKPNTGGIRIINEYQTVTRNYMYGLTGHRFRGALVIMNGVPNSPLNRYNQVVDSKMDGNIVIDCDYIQLCAGSDDERSAIPVGSSFSRNIIFGKVNKTPFTIYDDVSGITFDNNILNEELQAPFDAGFKKVSYDVVENSEGLKVPNQSLLKSIDFENIALPISKDSTGASYYSKPSQSVGFGENNTITVSAGTNTIIDALKANPTAVNLLLENGKTYLLTKNAEINHPVRIFSESGDKPIIFSSKSTFFKINNGGKLSLDNVIIDGAESPDQAGNNVISTSKYSMNKNYALQVLNTEVRNLDVNHTFDFLKVYKNTFSDSIVIRNTVMDNVTGSILSLDKELEDLGIYNVENVVISNSSFTNIQGSVANVYRGGTDESTFGPLVWISDCKFENVGHGKRNKVQSSLRFHGVQKMVIDNCEWKDSKPMALHLTNGEPIAKIMNSQFINTTNIQSNHNDFEKLNVKYIR